MDCIYGTICACAFGREESPGAELTRSGRSSDTSGDGPNYTIGGVER